MHFIQRDLLAEMFPENKTHELSRKYTRKIFMYVMYVMK